MACAIFPALSAVKVSELEPLSLMLVGHGDEGPRPALLAFDRMDGNDDPLALYLTPDDATEMDPRPHSCEEIADNEVVLAINEPWRLVLDIGPGHLRGQFSAAHERCSGVHVWKDEHHLRARRIDGFTPRRPLTYINLTSGLVLRRLPHAHEGFFCTSWAIEVGNGDNRLRLSGW